MTGKRQHRSLARGRSILALSVLALLALSCPPALAGADSSGIQYEDAPPTVSGGKAKQDREQSAGASGAASGGSSAGGAAGGGGSGSSGSGSGGGAASGSGGVGTVDGAAGQGNPGAGSPGSVGSAQALEAGRPASSGGGSSPLVPILIAIAALAAISLGALLIRHRRRGASDSPAASSLPEAG